jgi:dolichyl-phosphate-mannose--protein O-mannosyl transferase
MAAALLTLLLAILVFFAAREMFGVEAALIALTLLVFDPNVLAHGAVVGTDMGLTCFMFAAIYAFYRYVRVPSTKRLILVGVATGLAFAAKHTGILLVPMLLMLAVAELLRKNGEGSKPAGQRAKQLVIAFAVISAIALTTLWASYGFRYVARGEGLQLNPPLAQSVHYLSRPRVRHDCWKPWRVTACFRSLTFSGSRMSGSCRISTRAICSDGFIRTVSGTTSRRRLRSSQLYRFYFCSDSRCG